jgi:RNA polymerase sigma-70 factor (ECF subfamily)
MPELIADPYLSLVDAARGGGRRDAEALLRALLPRVRNLVRYLMRGDEDVDDAAQESLIAIVRGLAGYRGEGKFTSWADRIVARTTFALIGKRAPRAQALDDDAPQVAIAPAAADAYLERRRLAQLLDALPDAQRSAVVLHFVLGLSVPELAAELDCPEETARSRLRLGLSRLRALGDHDQPARGERVDGR